MKIDLYTKSVLTVIAFSLSVIALKNTIPSAFAQSNSPVKVVICDEHVASVCADVSLGSGLKVDAR
jgi:hypothetical protein